MISITCHDKSFGATKWGPFKWNPPRDDGTSIWETCSYCGCMHPDYLLNALKDPLTVLGGSDWKYGFPHKFYITVVNPDPEKLFVDCSTNFERPNTVKVDDRWVDYGKRKTLHGKFYSVHLMDDGVNPELFDLLYKASKIRFVIKFNPDGTKDLHYAAPYHGYQA